MSAHNILSDLTVKNTVNAVSGFQVNGAAPLNSFLKGDGTKFVPGYLSSSDLPSHTHWASDLSGGTVPGSVTWGGVAIAYGSLSGVPSTFTPASHVHSGADITSGTIPGGVTWGGVAIAYSSLSGVPSTFTPASHVHSGADITSGTIPGTVTWGGVAVGALYGGTGLTTYDTGELLVGNVSGTLTGLAIGTAGQVLTVSGGDAVWATPSGGSGTVTSVGVSVPAWLSASAAITTSGNITLAVSGSSSGALLVGAGATSASWLAVPSAKKFLTISASNIVAWSSSSNSWFKATCTPCRSPCCSPSSADVGGVIFALIEDLQALGVLS
jgi:hypothetical protein